MKFDKGTFNKLVKDKPRQKGSKVKIKTVFQPTNELKFIAVLCEAPLMVEPNIEIYPFRKLMLKKLDKENREHTVVAATTMEQALERAKRQFILRRMPRYGDNEISCFILNRWQEIKTITMADHLNKWIPVVAQKATFTAHATSGDFIPAKRVSKKVATKIVTQHGSIKLTGWLKEFYVFVRQLHLDRKKKS